LQNVDKAKKEIERLEAETENSDAKTNGNSADNVAADLEKTKIEETSS
jgi:hypothetical protein